MQPFMSGSSPSIRLEVKYSKNQDDTRDRGWQERGPQVSVWRTAKSSDMHMPILNCCISKSNLCIMLRYLKFGILSYSTEPALINTESSVFWQRNEANC